ncbi:MAG: hypothetical protein JHC87_01055 [Thermoleophilaceae bacterium]|nr:hypothetical protein [Thermoleophilaceae bacterium]
MSKRLQLEASQVQKRIEFGDPYWPAQLAIAVTILLSLTHVERVTVGPNWLLASIEGVMLAVLIVITPMRATEHSVARQRLALALVGVVSLANIVSLGLLADSLINGAQQDGRKLILSGLVLWATYVLLFAVFYWELDRGGPAARFLGQHELADFQFPQMENPQLASAGWAPGFGDYLYTSLTNAMAFSPTDTMPLTHTAKAAMGTQAAAAMLTIGLIVARAVNILG